MEEFNRYLCGFPDGFLKEDGYIDVDFPLTAKQKESICFKFLFYHNNMCYLNSNGYSYRGWKSLDDNERKKEDFNNEYLAQLTYDFFKDDSQMRTKFLKDYYS